MKSKTPKKPTPKAKSAAALRDLPTPKNPSGGARKAHEDQEK